jgi:branched-chain amino acid transport system permease protein
MNRRMLQELVMALLVSVAIVLFTVFVAPAARVPLLNTFVAYVALALMLDLLVGRLGILAAGHAAFFGCGAYISILLFEKRGWPLPFGTAAAVVIVGVVALLIGLPATKRTSGMHFAIVTMAFGEMLIQVVELRPRLTGGSEGLGTSWGLRSDFPGGVSIYQFSSVVLGAVLMVALTVAIVVRNTQIGLRFKVIKESEALAQSLRFNPTVYKTGAFVVASMVAALVGAVYGPAFGFVNPSLMGFQTTILLFAFVVVGGLERISASFLGAGLLFVLPELLDLKPALRLLCVGLAMAVVVLVEPKGIMGLLARASALVRRRVRSKPPTAAEVAP